MNTEIIQTPEETKILTAYIEGAVWQKEQDKAIIKELRDQLEITRKSLATYGSHPIIEKGNKVVIDKAQTYID